MERVIAEDGAGTLDGSEIGQGEYVLFAYGPDADQLYQTIEPLLRSSPASKGGFVVKRYGPADSTAKEDRVDL